MIEILAACAFAIDVTGAAPVLQFDFARSSGPGCAEVLPNTVITAFFENSAAFEAVVPAGAAGGLRARCTEETRAGCERFYAALLAEGAAALQFRLFRGVLAEFADVLVRMGDAEPLLLEIGEGGVNLLGVSTPPEEVHCAYYAVSKGAAAGGRKTVAFALDAGKYAETGDQRVVERYFRKEVVITICQTDTADAIPVLKRPFLKQTAQRVGSFAVAIVLLIACFGVLCTIITFRLKIGAKTRFMAAYGAYTNENVVSEQQIFQDIRGFF